MKSQKVRIDLQEKKLRTNTRGWYYFIEQISSVTQSCPTLCDPMDCSLLGSLSITNSQSLLKLMSIELVMPPTISSSVVPFSSCLQSFQASGSFQMSQFFTSGGQSVGVSVSASVFAVNIQDWSPLRFTGWIFLQSKGLSRGFSSTAVQKHQFFGAQLSIKKLSHPYMTAGKTHRYEIKTWFRNVVECDFLTIKK